jgi:hypothetical protein
MDGIIPSPFTHVVVHSEVTDVWPSANLEKLSGRGECKTESWQELKDGHYEETITYHDSDSF